MSQHLHAQVTSRIYWLQIDPNRQNNKITNTIVSRSLQYYEYAYSLVLHKMPYILFLVYYL